MLGNLQQQKTTQEAHYEQQRFIWDLTTFEHGPDYRLFSLNCFQGFTASMLMPGLYLD
jgi:hypothetical protein